MKLKAIKKSGGFRDGDVHYPLSSHSSISVGRKITLKCLSPEVIAVLVPTRGRDFNYGFYDRKHWNWRHAALPCHGL